ncbi:MAG: ABC transporter ATP-binding protein [Puniceicoccales bacterium]|jgi:ABC-type dipeptide/oligopeptide/nickel transport system ATPase component|nr:ABC transporter ATP-binding protein [Puniceicoccales bacterium]
MTMLENAKQIKKFDIIVDLRISKFFSNNSMSNNPYLSVRNLEISFSNAKKPTVHDISLTIDYGETLALVGRSGSGKTLIATSLMRLQSHTSITGEIILDQQSILNLPLAELVSIRRRKVSYIFQEPGNSLNPSLTIGYQLLEIVEGMDKKKRILDILKKVGFTNLKQIIHAYPHELSGGMQQRVMIAMALVNNPKLLIADEPTAALDVVLQKQVLNLIKKMQKELGFAILLITHDFSFLQQVADRICVIYKGTIVEQGIPDDIIFYPQHVHTKLLSESILTL